MDVLYAKLLVVVGIAVPVATNLNCQSTSCSDRITGNIVEPLKCKSDLKNGNNLTTLFPYCGEGRQPYVSQRNDNNETLADVLASFCLRLGAVVFGPGSPVFTRLQIGAEIASGLFRMIISDIRLLLVAAQMHFIFLNGKNLGSAGHAVPS